MRETHPVLPLSTVSGLKTHGLETKAALANAASSSRRFLPEPGAAFRTHRPYDLRLSWHVSGPWITSAHLWLEGQVARGKGERCNERRGASLGLGGPYERDDFLIRRTRYVHVGHTRE